MKKITKLRNISKSNQSKKNIAQKKDYVIEKNIDQNFKNFNDILGKNDDTVFRNFKISMDKQIKAFICFIDGLVDKKSFSDFVIKDLMANIKLEIFDKHLSSEDIITVLNENVLNIVDTKETNSFDTVLEGIMSGFVALFIDGCNTVLIMDSRSFQCRAIEEPETDRNVRGPREGFTENLRVNTTLIRRIIKNPNLIIESLKLGRQTNTKVCISYIEGIAEINIIQEVKKRLSEIDIDSILESGYIEQLIEDNSFSLFTRIGNSEKPDKVAAKLLEGRVAILCEGSPFVLTVPYLFIESFQATEDYYSRWIFVSFIRLIRIIAFIITLLAPSLYIALETYHQQMIPTVLLLTASAAREGTPFPTVVEVIIMQFLFEILRESGVRLPRPIGQSVSMIGALVIGEAAVQAGIISQPMVIIGALTAITSFIITPIYDGVTIFRYFLIILSSIYGLYGIVIGLIIMLIHLCSLDSFGIAYLSPIAPTVGNELKDAIIRFPLWLLTLRPKSITKRNRRRQSSSQESNNSKK